MLVVRISGCGIGPANIGLIPQKQFLTAPVSLLLKDFRGSSSGPMCDGLTVLTKNFQLFVESSCQTEFDQWHAWK